MCNDAIRIALKEQPKNRFALQSLAYPLLKKYGLHTHYLLSACEVAFAAYRNKKRQRDPYFKGIFLKLDNQTYVLNHLMLRIPTTPRHFIYLSLKASDYHLSLLSNPALKKGSLTLTPRAAGIAVSKDIAEVEPVGNLGIDINERNVTMSDPLHGATIWDTSEVAELKERYRCLRARIGERKGRDYRISRRLYAKYGKRERDRTAQRIHLVTKAIVEHARTNKLRIIMEDLIGIRKRFRKGNGQGTSFRARMNSWTFREFQAQVQYKTRWEGLPIRRVNPRNTSRNCSKCGSSQRFEGRTVICPSCRQIEDRDVNASRNIMMACAVPQVRPTRESCEEAPHRGKVGGSLGADDWKMRFEDFVQEPHQN